MKEGTNQEGLKPIEADVFIGQDGGETEESLWPRFGQPLVEPVGGGEAVKEGDLSWLQELD